MKNCVILSREEQGNLLRASGYNTRYFRTYSSDKTPFWLGGVPLLQGKELMDRYGDETSYMDDMRDGHGTISMSRHMTCKLVAGLLHVHAVLDVTVYRGTDLLVVFDESQVKESSVELYGAFFKNTKDGSYDLIEVHDRPEVAWRNALSKIWSMGDEDHDEADSIIRARTVTTVKRTTEWKPAKKETVDKLRMDVAGDYPTAAAGIKAN